MVPAQLAREKSQHEDPEVHPQDSHSENGVERGPEGAGGGLYVRTTCGPARALQERRCKRVKKAGRGLDAARRCLDACRRAGRTAVSTGAGNRAGEEKIALARATTMPSVFAVSFRFPHVRLFSPPR